MFKLYDIAEAQPGFGMEAKDFFVKFRNLHVAKRSKATRFATDVRGQAPPPREIFLKWCNLVHFGVYLDQIFSLKTFKKLPIFI